MFQKYKNSLNKALDTINQEQLDILYQDIKNDNVKNGAFVSLLDKVVEKYPEP